MSLKTIQLALFDVLKEIKAMCGFEWDEVTSTASTPLNDLPGFDSLCSVEATVMVEEKLGCGELKSNSVFMSIDGKRALTIDESSHLIQDLIKEKEGKK